MGVSRYISVVLFLLVVGLFARAISFEFLNWDDAKHLLQNPYLNPPSLSNVVQIWVKPYFGLYIPVTYSVWAVITRVARLETPDENGLTLNPYPFHAANVLLHAGNAVLVYVLIRRLLRGRDEKAVSWPAIAAAVFWAVHPIQVEAVAWVSGLKDVLFGFFSLGALLAYVKFVERAQEGGAARGTGERAIPLVVLGTAALILAMLSKPMAVVVPLIAAALTWWERPAIPRRAKWLLGGWLALAVMAAVLAQVVQPPGKMAARSPPWARPLVATDAVAFYLYKLALPIHFAPAYDDAPLTILASGRLLYSWIAPLALLAVLWRLPQRRRWLVAYAIFLLGVLPVSGLVPFHFQEYSTVADRYVYLAMLGPALGLAWALSQWNSRALWIGCAIVLGALIVRMEIQLPIWRDSVTLWRHQVALYPGSYVGFGNLGAALIDAHRHDEAQSPLERAIAIKPDYAIALNNLGIVFYTRGNLDAAMVEYGQSLKFDPQYLPAYRCMGDAWLEKGQPERAIQWFTLALQVDPDSQEMKDGLSRALAQRAGMASPRPTSSP